MRLKGSKHRRGAHWPIRFITQTLTEVSFLINVAADSGARIAQ